MNLFRLFFLSIIFSGVVLEASAQNQKQLIVRLDDLGMCHSVNVAAEKIFKTGIPISASLMVPCSWFPEAVNILKKYPNVAVGIHVTLNAEWTAYKWGPVAGRGTVPSLVDSNGFFTEKVTWFFKDIFKLNELETEIRAQIQMALDAGLKIDYIDGHMGAGFQSEEQIALIKKLANEYNLAISTFYGEKGIGGIDGYSSKGNPKQIYTELAKLESGPIYLMVNHPGLDSFEMQALTQASGKNISKDRQAVTDVLSSKKFLNYVAKNNIQLINYRSVKEQRGLTFVK